MAQLERLRIPAPAVEEEEEEEQGRPLMEEVTFLDIDMLCSAVAMQANGNWGKVNGDGEDDNFVAEYHQGGGVFRMWEGEIVSDCLDDRRIALQSTCCPCYRFGKNMKRAGLGSCFLQGSILLILAAIAICNLLAFIITRRHLFIYLAISMAASIGAYLGYHRMRIREKFNIKDEDSSLDDCVYHLVCPCCTLCQESRTLEMNNVEDGVWHGRGGDTICIGSSLSDGASAAAIAIANPHVELEVELNPPFIISTKSSEFINIHKTGI